MAKHELWELQQMQSLPLKAKVQMTITRIRAWVEEYGEEPLSFGDILQKCKDKGYIGGIILVIAENPLSGYVFQYGNYDDIYWYVVGETKGYA